MLSREDFIFTIGYDGPVAVVDGQAKRKYSKLSIEELARKGLFRAAYAAAIFSGESKDMETVLTEYNRIAGTAYSTASPPDRLFGVFHIGYSKRVLVL